MKTIQEREPQGRGLANFLGGHGSRKDKRSDVSTLRRNRRCSSSSEAEKRDRTPQRNRNTRSFRYYKLKIGLQKAIQC